MSSITRKVTEADTAISVGSGNVPVLGTPVLIAWLEAATVAALELPEGQTSVGINVNVDHILASGVGSTITATANITEQTEKTVTFEVQAVDQENRPVARGSVQRAIVNTERFIDRIPSVPN